MTSLMHKQWLLVLPCASIFVVAVLAIGCGAESRPPMSAAPPSDAETPEDGARPSGEYGSVQYADESNFEELVLRAKGPVLVDFYADWCPPCRVLAPTLEELARETPELLVVKVDVDQARGLARQYAIQSIPSLKVFHEGEIVNQHVGLASKEELKSLVGM